MHTQSLDHWQHQHAFLGERHEHHERRTWMVVAVAGVMMVAEIVGGTVYGSMALVADGWHMCTHVAALSITALAYLFARRHIDNPRFSFGTGKLGDLAGFASALILGMISLLIGYESLMRLAEPVTIRFNEAIAIATLGLAVNLVSAWLLRDDHHHGHGHEDEHDHDHEHDHAHEHDHEHPHDHEQDHAHHRDHNLHSAYAHVLADALTSVLAIGGLLTARFYGFVWIDPVIGLVGAGVIAAWSLSLIRSSGAVLLDTVPSNRLAERVRERLERGDDRVTDLHLWRVGPGHAALVVTIVSDRPQPPAVYKRRLDDLAGLSHITVEVHPCPGHALAGSSPAC